MTDSKVSWGFLDLVLIYAAALFLGAPLLSGLLLFLLPVQADSLLYFTMSSFGLYGSLLLLIALALRLRRVGWRDLGFRSLPWASLSRYGIGGGLLLIVLMMACSIVITQLQPELPGQPIEQILRESSSWQHYLSLFLLGALLGPWVEEVFFRGMLYPVFRQHLGVKWGIIVAGLLFGLIHADLWRALPLALGGMGLCYIYEKTGSIWAPTMAHGLWNGLMYLMIVWQMSLG